MGWLLHVLETNGDDDQTASAHPSPVLTGKEKENENEKKLSSFHLAVAYKFTNIKRKETASNKLNNSLYLTASFTAIE